MSEGKQIIPTFDHTSTDMMDEQIENIGTFLDEKLVEGKDWAYAHKVFGRELREGDEPKKMLLDPGCSKIMNYMRVRPRHINIECELDTETNHLKYSLKAELVPWLPVMYYNPSTKEMEQIFPVIAEGIASSTTREKRYKIRFEWFKERVLKAEGYTDPELEKYRKRYPDRYKPSKNYGDTYYMASLEGLGLDNTLIKMAAKRAEMDAVFQLPGVAGKFSQEIDIYDTKLDKDGNRGGEPDSDETSEETPAEEAEEDWDETQGEEVMKLTGWSKDEVIAEVDSLIKKSDGLLVNRMAALSVLLRNAKRGDYTKSEEPEDKPTQEPQDEALTQELSESEDVVRKALEDNGLDVTDFSFLLYKKRVLVKPPETLSIDELVPYNEVIVKLKGDWDYEKEQWELPL